MNTTTKVLIAAAAGVAVGTVLGILFAPAKGEQTRETLMKKGKDLAADYARRCKTMKNHFEEEVTS